MPTFFEPLIWIDFSSMQAESDNWERLIRTLYGQPAFRKPPQGSPPAYLLSVDAAAVRPSLSTLRVLENAIRQEKKLLGPYRRALIEDCLRYADSLRTRQRPDPGALPQKVYEDCLALKAVRDDLTAWVLMEAEAADRGEFTDALLTLLESVYELTTRPEDLQGVWNDRWSEAHEVFAFDTFLHVIAALLRRRAYDVLHDVFHYHYSVPRVVAGSSGKFDRFSVFQAEARHLQSVLAPEGRTLHSPAGEFIKRNPGSEVPFDSVIEADLLAFLMALIVDCHWHPQTLVYLDYSVQLPLFTRAARHRDFRALSTTTGVENADELRRVVNEGYQRAGFDRTWEFRRMGLGGLLNIEHWDTLK